MENQKKIFEMILYDNFTEKQGISLPDYINKEKSIFEKIDTLVRIEKLPTNKSRILNLLDELKSDLLEILSKYTEKYLKEKKIFPKY